MADCLVQKWPAHQSRWPLPDGGSPGWTSQPPPIYGATRRWRRVHCLRHQHERKCCLLREAICGVICSRSSEIHTTTCSAEDQVKYESKQILQSVWFKCSLHFECSSDPHHLVLWAVLLAAHLAVHPDDLPLVGLMRLTNNSWKDFTNPYLSWNLLHVNALRGKLPDLTWRLLADQCLTPIGSTMVRHT